MSKHDKQFDILNGYDVVNKPAHYNQGNIECIDAMLAAFGIKDVVAYCMCNAFKYVWRYKYKNGIEDLEKAIWYLNKGVELLENTVNSAD